MLGLVHCRLEQAHTMPCFKSHSEGNVGVIVSIIACKLQLAWVSPAAWHSVLQMTILASHHCGNELKSIVVES